MLTHLFLIRTSLFFCKTQAPDLLWKGRWFCAEAGLDSSHELSTPEQNRWVVAPDVAVPPSCLSQGWGLWCRCQAQDLLFGHRCWHLGGFRLLAMAASAQPARIAPRGLLGWVVCRIGAVASCGPSVFKTGKKSDVASFMGVTIT